MCLKFIHPKFSRACRGRVSVFFLLIVTQFTLLGCGGADEDPTISIVAGIRESYLAQGPGAALKEEQDLRREGIKTSNRRCRVSSGRDLNGNLQVLFIDGIHPRLVIFDIPASQLERAKALDYVPYDPSQLWTGEFPFREFNCEEAGL